MSFFPDRPMTEQYDEIELILSVGKKRKETRIRKWMLPLQIERDFGDIKFKFIEGGLLKFKNYIFREEGLTLEYDRGDYQIQVSIGKEGFRTFTDGKAWKLLLLKGLDGLSDEKRKVFLKHLYDLWERLKVPEKKIHQQIREFGLRKELQAFLYYSWHRIHVEERAYPSFSSPYYKEDERPNPSLNGGRTFLGATYFVIQKGKNPDKAEERFKKRDSKQEALNYFEGLRKLAMED